MGEHDDQRAEPDGHVLRRGRSTDGRPYVMVLAVAPWTSPPAPAATAQMPTTADTGPRR
jgi:hypothetical protein